jgi:hypothetical protein
MVHRQCVPRILSDWCPFLKWTGDSILYGPEGLCPIFPGPNWSIALLQGDLRVLGWFGGLQISN